MEKEKRLIWIDIAKGIAILTVVTTHTGFLPFSKITSPLIGAWMLPIFPFLGGYLYQEKNSLHQLMIKRACQLLIPYILVGILSFLGGIFLRSHYPQGKLMTPLQPIFIDFILGRGTMFNGPLWFLPTYFLTLTCGYIFYKIMKSKSTLIRMIFFILLALGSLWLMKQKMVFPFSLDIALLFSCFYFAGIYAKQLPFQPNPILICISAFLFLSTSLINGTIDINFHLIGQPVLFLISAFTGIYLVIIASRQLEHYQNILQYFLRYWGKNSLLLLTVHWPIILWTSYLLKLSTIPDHIGARINGISFLLPTVNGFMIRIYIFLFLFFYLTIILGCTLLANRYLIKHLKMNIL